MTIVFGRRIALASIPTLVLAYASPAGADFAQPPPGELATGALRLEQDHAHARANPPPADVGMPSEGDDQGSDPGREINALRPPQATRWYWFALLAAPVALVPLAVLYRAGRVKIRRPYPARGPRLVRRGQARHDPNGVFIPTKPDAQNLRRPRDTVQHIRTALWLLGPDDELPGRLPDRQDRDKP